MQVGKLYFTRHAIRQMFERRITTDQVRRVIETGEVITETLLARAERAEHDGTQVQVVQFAA